MLRSIKDKNFSDPARLKTLPNPTINLLSLASPIFSTKFLKTPYSSYKFSLELTNFVSDLACGIKLRAMHCFYCTPLLQKKLSSIKVWLTNCHSLAVIIES